MLNLIIKQNITKYYYFIAINSLLLSLLGIGYFIRDPARSYLLLPSSSDWLAIVYIITSHFLHVILYLVIFSILLLPSFWLTAKKRQIIQLSVIIFAISIAVLDILMFYMHGINITDTFVSICYNAIVINLVTNIFSVKKIILVTGFIFFCLFEYFLYNLVASKTWLEQHAFGKKYFTFIALCFFTTLIIYISSDKNSKQNLVAYTQHLPWIVIGNKQIINKIDSINKQIVLTKFTKFINNTNNKLNYPSKELKTNHIENPPNILIIAIDGWRKDCFNEVDSPNLWQFAQNGKIFYNHKSAANATLGGIFSLFYAIPASYWHNFLENKRIPILFDRLHQLDYQISMFTPAGSPLPYFITSQQWPQAKLEFEFNASTSCKEDEIATNSLLNWYQNISKSKPWFAFIFYDSAHGHNFPENYSKNYQPISDSNFKYVNIAKQYGKDYFINTYKLGVHYADKLAGKILEQLKASDDLKNTIVIITSDHGKEFNDTKQNQWGHATNFTDYQMQVPFAIIGPKVNNCRLNWQDDDLTTNYDVVPTLMQSFLGVTNDTNDYSIGINLLKDRISRDWMLATGFGFYSFFCSIIDNQSSIRWLPSGRHWFTDNMNNNLINQTINNKLLEQALEQMTRFIEK